jgi:hypothetical protein
MSTRARPPTRPAEGQVTVEGGQQAVGQQLLAGRTVEEERRAGLAGTRSHRLASTYYQTA